MQKVWKHILLGWIIALIISIPQLGYGQWIELKGRIGVQISLQDSVGSGFGGGVSGGYIFKNKLFANLQWAYFKAQTRSGIDASFAPVTIAVGYYFGTEKWIPFVSVGGGFFRYNLSVPNQRSDTDFTSHLYGCIDTQTGLQYMLSENFGIYGSGRYRFAFATPALQFIDIETGICIRF